MIPRNYKTPPSLKVPGRAGDGSLIRRVRPNRKPRRRPEGSCRRETPSRTRRERDRGIKRLRRWLRASLGVAHLGLPEKKTCRSIPTEEDLALGTPSEGWWVNWGSTSPQIGSSTSCFRLDLWDKRKKLFISRPCRFRVAHRPLWPPEPFLSYDYRRTSPAFRVGPIPRGRRSETSRGEVGSSGPPVN